MEYAHSSLFGVGVAVQHEAGLRQAGLVVRLPRPVLNPRRWICGTSADVPQYRQVMQ